MPSAPSTNVAPTTALLDGGAPQIPPIDPDAERVKVAAEQRAADRERAGRKFFAPRMSDDMERIVENIFTIDVKITYDRIIASLQLRDDSRDYHSVNAALDRAEVIARDAWRIASIARIERERWDIDAEIIRGAMRKEAMAALTQLKDKGEYSKAIHNPDVDAQMARMFPDEWRDLEEKKAKAHEAAKNMEKLAELAVARIRTLQVLLSTLRK